MNSSGEHNRHATHARLDEPRHVELSPEPAMARRQLEGVLARAWPGDVPGVLLAVSEALVNANRHAGGARRADAWVRGSSVVVQVCDNGQAFDPTPFTDSAPDTMAERGRGLWLISQLADTCQIRHDDDGGRMLLRFDARLEREKAGCRPG
jgi:anti-sigma regulatory factor (Ser/Thr protein kinase)